MPETLPKAPLSHASRNQVFTALFDLLKTTTPPTGQIWRTTSQHLRLWDSVDKGAQPALFLQRGPQVAAQNSTRGATRWQWNCWAWIYYQVGGLKNSQTLYPDQLTDQFLDNIEQVLATDPIDGPRTLGGLVQHVWINGTIFTEAGIEDDQAFMIIPISILV